MRNTEEKNVSGEKSGGISSSAANEGKWVARSERECDVSPSERRYQNVFDELQQLATSWANEMRS